MKNMFNWLISQKPQTKLDLDKTYLIIEFLTKQQKKRKDIVISKLKKKYEDTDNSVIIPYQDHFKCSFRYKFNAKAISNSKQIITQSKIKVSEITKNLILSNDKQLKIFMETYYNGIDQIYQNDCLLNQNDVIELYDQRQVQMYCPQQVVQIIYLERTLLERMKSKTVNFVKNIPSMCYNLISKIFWFVLSLLGLNSSITSLIWKSSGGMIIQGLSLVGNILLPGWISIIFTLLKKFF